MIKIKRPLVFLDFETTGVDPKESRIVQIAAVKLHADNEQHFFKTLINPEIPIPASATEVHGITNEMVKEALTFKVASQSFLLYITGCDLAGFNSNRFDLPLLHKEFTRAGKKWNWKESLFIDVCNIYKIMEPRTLGAAHEFYTGEPLEGAHDALNDVKATIKVFEEQLIKYEMQDSDLDKIALFSNYGKEIVDITGHFTKDDQGFLVLTFGKHKDKRAVDVKGYDPNYFNWILKSDFEPEVKELATNILYKGWK